MAKKAQVVKYKKAPQAPRRFKSSYMFFSTEKHGSIRKELVGKGNTEKLSTTEVAKMVSRAWKHISTDEREIWEDLARKDKARYEMEKTMYTGPWKVPAKKRSQKDPNAPKRPMSAFLSFSNAKRSCVKRKHPDIGNAEVSRILAQMWKDAAEDEKKDHIDEEFKLRQIYKIAIAEWRKNSEDEMQATRKEREDQAMRAVLEGRSALDLSSYAANRPLDSCGFLNGSTEYQYGQQPQHARASGSYNAAPKTPSTQPSYYAPPHYYGQTGGYPDKNASALSSMVDPSSYGSYYERPPAYDGYGQHFQHGTYLSAPLAHTVENGSVQSYDPHYSAGGGHVAYAQDPYGQPASYYSNHAAEAGEVRSPNAQANSSYQYTGYHQS